jgi:uncharacterized coiled-coil protein SlyX
MSQVEARISQLREAAEQLRRSSRRLQESIQATTDAVDPLIALSATPPNFTPRYLAFRTQMTEWASTLDRFADQLGSAANDIDAARDGRTYPGFMLLRRRRRVRPYLPERRADPAALAPAPTPQPRPIGGYISERNKALYEQWRDRSDELQGREAALAGLIETRQQKAEDLAALRNRLHSYDPTRDIDQIPRIQAMQAEITQLDADMAATQNEIDIMQARVDHLEGRLSRVNPGPGANDATLIALEQGETAPWLHDNTFDCVRHVVGKFNVPANLAVDAHLWDDMAAQFSEYGVTTGDIPLEGSVLMMTPEHPYADDINGHIMYVERVENGVVWVSDDKNPAPVRLDEVTTEQQQDMTYLYFPWHTIG